MNETTRQAALSALRSILMVVGATLVSAGYLTDAMLNQIVGAIIVIVPLLWGVWDKYQTEKKTQAREAVAVNAGVNAASSTPGATPIVSPAQAQQVIKDFAPSTTAATPSPQPEKGPNP